jgi:hypothetical protein
LGQGQAGDDGVFHGGAVFGGNGVGNGADEVLDYAGSGANVRTHGDRDNGGKVFKVREVLYIDRRSLDLAVNARKGKARNLFGGTNLPGGTECAAACACIVRGAAGGKAQENKQRREKKKIGLVQEPLLLLYDMLVVTCLWGKGKANAGTGAKLAALTETFLA